MKILQADHLINQSNIQEFTLSTQDCVIGGFSKWADTNPGLYHVYITITGEIGLKNQHSKTLNTSNILSFR